MPNAEYLRLKALLKSNPQYKVMLDTISKAEGTWGKDAYSTKYGGKKVDWNKGKDRSSNGVSNAHGKYQFMNTTWDELSKELGLEGFSPEEQDVAAMKLLEKTDSLKHIENGDLKKAIFSAAPTWAGLPKNEKGESYHKFKNGKQQSAKSLNTVLGYMKSNEAARAEINNQYKELNNKNSSSKDAYQISKNKEKIKSYWSEISDIQKNKDLSEADKNAKKHLVKQKYYREGYMSSVNIDINETNKKYDIFINNMKKMSGKKGEDLISKEGMIRVNSGVVTKKQYEELKKEALQFNIDLGDPKYSVSGGDESNKNAVRYIKPGYIERKLNEFKSLYTPRKIESGLLKYGKTKDEYDSEVNANTPSDNNYDSGLVSDVENGTAKVNETEQEKAVREKVEASEKARAAKLLADKNKPFEGSDILNNITKQEEWSDPQFKYTPGKQKLPYDALMGAATGLLGAASADSVDIKYRDEQISEGMLLYAQDIAKIRKMGLTPEMEGSLKMKLQDAYQTGIDNLVSFSNGNRNLVLGNQGQLDKARMEGIVNIAAMDVDRTDKAMAAFGEVQKYISEFDSRRDIANNERKYQEDKQKQSAGMAVAQQGMSSFIDAINNAQENGPGSMNDMRRQLFQFNVTGILPNAKEGEPGSKSFIEAVKVKQKLNTEKKRTYADWINSKTAEDQDLINNILQKNPNLDPTKNDNTEFKELENFYNDVSGTNEYKSDFYKSKNISDLTVSNVEKKADELTVEKPPEVLLEEKQYLSSLNEPIKHVADKAVEAPVSPVIVTSDKLPNNVLAQQLANGANNKETGVNTLNIAEIEKQQMIQQKNEMNQLLSKQKSTIDGLTSKATDVLQSNEKSNQVIDNITNKAYSDIQSLLNNK